MDPKKIFESDERIVSIREYNGFVANAYKYPCPREYTEYYLDGTVVKGTYDAKRSHGRGPRWVAYSERGGVLQRG